MHAHGDTRITRSVLPSGLRVITEPMPHLRSVALGVWVGVGSVDEPESLAGATHYLEHWLFRRTRKRTGPEINKLIDGAGGLLNAFTSKEFTCYYARTLDDDLDLALDVLGDIVSEPSLTTADFEAERQVIGEELAMAGDDPADAVHELFAEALFREHPLARPILGTEESVSSLSRNQVAGWFRRRYTPPRIVVTAVGNVDHGRVVAQVRKHLAGLLERHDDAEPEPPRQVSRHRVPSGTDATTPLIERRPTEQAHVLLGMPGLPRVHADRMPLSVVNAVLGGGLSSRLFADIREARGLAYSVFSYTNSFVDGGSVGVYAGCQPERVVEVVDRVRGHIDDVARNGISQAELDLAKGSLRGSLVLGAEDPGSRMMRLGKAELVYPDYRCTDELLAGVDDVTLERANAVATEVLSQPPALAAVGPFRNQRSIAGAHRRSRREALR
jgi:predicted Zn-dependent peptidase